MGSRWHRAIAFKLVDFGSPSGKIEGIDFAGSLVNASRAYGLNMALSVPSLLCLKVLPHIYRANILALVSARQLT